MAINQAPAVSGSAMVAAIDEDGIYLPGVTVASLVGGNFIDRDGPGSLIGIAVAIQAFDGSKGDWKHSTNGGTNTHGHRKTGSMRLDDDAWPGDRPHQRCLCSPTVWRQA